MTVHKRAVAMLRMNQKKQFALGTWENVPPRPEVTRWIDALDIEFYCGCRLITAVEQLPGNMSDEEITNRVNEIPNKLTHDNLLPKSWKQSCYMYDRSCLGVADCNVVRIGGLPYFEVHIELWWRGVAIGSKQSL